MKNHLRLCWTLALLVCLAQWPQTCHAKPLLFSTQQGTVAGKLRIRYNMDSAYDRDAAIFTFTAIGGEGKAEFRVFKIQGTTKVELTRHLVRGTDLGPLTMTFTGLKKWLLAVELKGRADDQTVHFTLRVERPGAGEPHKIEGNVKNWDFPICGLVDLHNHQMGDLAYGGNRFDATHDGRLPAPDEDGMSRFHKEVLLMQRVHSSMLLSAHAQGLNLLVVAVTNEHHFCAPGAPMSCNDMETAIRQIRAIQDFAEAHSDYYEVALDPWQARRIIMQGKLAVVIALEVSDLFPQSRGSWKDQLWELYDMGLRSIQIVHQYNSLFAGAAPHRMEKNPEQWYDNGVRMQLRNNENALGLTSDGKDLLLEARRLGMIVDIAHMSRRAVRDFDALISTTRGDNKFKYWAVMNSHCSFADAVVPLIGKHLNEFSCDAFTVDFIKRNGGIIGLHTGIFPTVTFNGTNNINQVPNNCPGSDKSLAQQIQYAAAVDVDIGLATSMNGWALLTGPRFGPDACPTRFNFTNDTTIAPQKTKEYSEFDKAGLAHIDLLPDLVRDLVRLKASTESIVSSAERTLRTWERAFDTFRARKYRSNPNNWNQGGSRMLCEDFSVEGQEVHLAHTLGKLKDIVNSQSIAQVLGKEN